jgi:hypothetical protein
MVTELDPNEEDAALLWAEIFRLRAAVQGPDGYATWQEAATAERVRRVRAESKPTDEATDAEVTEAAVVMVYDRMDPFCAFGMGARWAEARLKAARLATPPDNAAGREGVK